MLTEVFGLKVLPNETVKGWIGRASELFDRLKRKTQVDLPEEARGWLLLHRCGLSEEQKAVVVAVLSVECLNSEHLDVEALIADYIKKKMQKDLPHSNSLFQSKVDAGKKAEW